MDREHGRSRVRNGPDHDPRHSERGVAVVLLALGALVLIAAAGLAIDAGRMFVERRVAQGAADHAATAAAFAACVGNSDATAVSKGLEAADNNGYDDNGVSNDVTVQSLGPAKYQSDIRSTISATFSRVIGFVDFDISVQAVADCDKLDQAGPGAMFAGGDDCKGFGKKQIDVSGSNQTVTGGVHSNGNLYIGSAPNIWTLPGLPPDPVTYADTLDANQAGNIYEAGYPAKVASRTWPAGYAPSDVPALLTKYKALAQANGTYFTSKVTSITTDGVYYTTHADGFDVSSVSGDRDVTLVAEQGPIKLSASGRIFTAHTDGILMLSGKTYSGIDRCDKFTVAVSGSSSTWNGLMWAPGGLLEMSGSSNSAVNGALVGWAIRLNGSNLTITYDPSFLRIPPAVILVE